MAEGIHVDIDGVNGESCTAMTLMMPYRFNQLYIDCTQREHCVNTKRRMSVTELMKAPYKTDA